MMNKALLPFLFLLVLTGLKTVYAQRSEEVRTIITRGTQVNGFGSLDLKVSNFNDRPTLLLGGQGGLLLDHHFYVGLAGYGLTTRNEFEGSGDGNTYRLYGGYGGIIFGAVVAPVEVVHLYVPVLVGAGSFDVSDPDFIIGGFPREVTIENSAFFIVEPGLQIDVNITRFFRLGLGGSYRLVEGTELAQTTDENLSSWAAEISFRFGRF